MQKVIFPENKNISINMMPILFGNLNTLPEELHGYISMINQCKFNIGETVYLTITETLLNIGEYNRRPGIHTDATNSLGWGGGGWGSIKDSNSGIYLASNDGASRIWDYDVTSKDVDHFGALLQNPMGNVIKAEPNVLYHIGEYTPHESLPSESNHVRQFFRLVGPKIGAWWEQHSTKNPFGVQPKAKILTHSKFNS
ncbi:MAG: hypothetical protein RL621_1856 [Bacteroidota bacterium]|jgi:hypothetical protein